MKIPKLSEIPLKPREKNLIIAGAVCLGIFIFIQFIVFPLYDKKSRLNNAIKGKERELVEILQLQKDYDSIRSKAEQAMQQIARRDKGFTLFSFLDRLAGEKGVKDRIAYMRPSITPKENAPYKISLVEMELQAITLPQLVGFLHGIETSENLVAVKRMSIASSGKLAASIDVVLQVETFEL